MDQVHQKIRYANTVAPEEVGHAITTITPELLKAWLEPEIIIPDPPIPYCFLHAMILKPSTLETKNCEAKKCPYFTRINKIVRWNNGQ